MSIKGIDENLVTGVSVAKLDLHDITDGQVIQIHTTEGATFWVAKTLKTVTPGGQVDAIRGCMVSSDVHVIAWSRDLCITRKLEVGKELNVGTAPNDMQGKSTITAIIAIP